MTSDLQEIDVMFAVPEQISITFKMLQVPAPKVEPGVRRGPSEVFCAPGVRKPKGCRPRTWERAPGVCSPPVLCCPGAGDGAMDANPSLGRFNPVTLACIDNWKHLITKTTLHVLHTSSRANRASSKATGLFFME